MVDFCIPTPMVDFQLAAASCLNHYGRDCGR